MRSESTPSTALGQTLHGERAGLDAAQGRWLLQSAEFDQRGDYTLDACATPVQWLTRYCGLMSVTARKYLRVARALRARPRITAALLDGRVSYTKVRAMTRVEEPDDETERALVAAAEVASAAEIERLVRHAGSSRSKTAHRRTTPWHGNGGGSVCVRSTTGSTRSS